MPPKRSQPSSASPEEHCIIIDDNPKSTPKLTSKASAKIGVTAGSKPTPQPATKTAPSTTQTSAPKSKPKLEAHEPILRYSLIDGPEVGGDLVTIILHSSKDDVQHKYYILGHALAQSSTYFRGCITAPRVSDKPLEIKLFDIEREAFEVYLKWIYTGRLFIRSLKTESAPVIDVEKQPERPSDLAWTEEWGRWGAAYALGQRLNDVDFKDACIDAAIEKLRQELRSARHVAQAIPNIIYTYSVDGSPARAFAVDLVLRQCTHADFEAIRKESAFPDFVGDLLVGTSKQFVMGMKQPDPLQGTNNCHYHEHSTVDAKCYKLKKAYWF